MQSGTVSQPHTDAHAHMHMHVLHKDVNTSTGAQCIYTCTWSCQSHQQPAESAPNHRLDQPDHAYMMYIDRWDRPCSRDTGCHTVYTCIYIHIRTGQVWDGMCMVDNIHTTYTSRNIDIRITIVHTMIKHMHMPHMSTHVNMQICNTICTTNTYTTIREQCGYDT